MSLGLQHLLGRCKASGVAGVADFLLVTTYQMRGQVCRNGKIFTGRSTSLHRGSVTLLCGV